MRWPWAKICSEKKGGIEEPFEACMEDTEFAKEMGKNQIDMEKEN